MNETNPYQSPPAAAESDAPSRRPGEDALYSAAQWHNVIGGLGLLGVSISLIDVIYVIFFDRTTASLDLSVVVIFAMMLPQSLLMLAGGISMHQHKRRWLAIAGAWAGILPFCGCTVFSLISGIWVLLVLRRPEVKALFAENQQVHPSVVDTPSGEAT